MYNCQVRPERWSKQNGAPVKWRFYHLVLVVTHKGFYVHQVSPHHVLHRHKGHPQSTSHQHEGKRKVGIFFYFYLMGNSLFNGPPIASGEAV